MLKYKWDKVIPINVVLVKNNKYISVISTQFFLRNVTWETLYQFFCFYETNIYASFLGRHLFIYRISEKFFLFLLSFFFFFRETDIVSITSIKQMQSKKWKHVSKTVWEWNIRMLLYSQIWENSKKEDLNDS